MQNKYQGDIEALERAAKAPDMAQHLKDKLLAKANELKLKQTPTSINTGGKITSTMTKQELENEIAKIKANKFLPEALKQKAIYQKEAQLKALQAEDGTLPSREPIGRMELSAEPKKVQKVEKKKSKPENKSIVVEGRTITEGEADFCDKVVAAWYIRRAKAKTAARATKTTPVFNRIAGEVADSVMKAVKSVSAAEIKKDPKDFKIEAEALSEKAKEFLGAFKSLLGSDFHQSEVESEFKELEKVIEALVEKHKKRMEDGGQVIPHTEIAIDIPASEAANEEVTVLEEKSEEKEIERALTLAHKAAKREVHATDTTFEGFKNRIKDNIEGSYTEMEIKIAYDCLHVTGFKNGGKVTNRIKLKYAKVAKVMREFYAGKLKTHKRVVKNRKQAQAIAMSEAGLSRN